jgi:Protein of unknown function (DUF4232)
MIRPALPARHLIAAGLLACGTVLLAACGSSASPSAGSTPTVTVTATPSASTASSPAGGGSGGSSSAPGGPASCDTSALQLNLGQGNGAAGSVIIPIQFTNTSSSACTLYGFPGVSFVTGVGGRQIGASAGEDSAATRRLVTLAPGAKAHALLQVVVAQNFPAAKCKLVHAHWLKVFPPGQTAALYLKYTSPTCSNPSTSVRVLGVQTMQPGDGSNA